MRRFFSIYQFLCPLIALPATWYLWLDEYGWNTKFVCLILSLPIISSYVVPGIGTNYLHIWEFNTKVRLGKFRPQHGFVFGTATALLVYLCLERSTSMVTWSEVLRTALVVGSVIGFWNWFYDALAVEAGFIQLYTKAWAEGKGPADITMEYAPVYFGMLGFVYGAEIKILQKILIENQRWDLYWPLFIICNVLTIAIPTLCYMGFSYMRTGEWGLKSYKDEEDVEGEVVAELKEEV